VVYDFNFWVIYFNSFLAQARADGEPPGLCSHPPVPPGIRAYIWPEEKAATHSTAKPNEHGVFAEPVYYDWDRDWGRVRGLLRRDDVQAILKECVNLHCDRGGHTGYYVVPYERHRNFPWYHMSHRRIGNEEQV
jgi:hypothetical protein